MTSKREGLASSKPLPVYSDFSHMSTKGGGGLSNISFVVGLRETNADSEKILHRVFPMTKIIPAVKAEKKKVKKKEKQEEKVCSRADCVARRERLIELNDENKGLKMKLKMLEGRIETTRNKVMLTEKSIIMAEEKNDTLNGQIEEAQAKIFSISADVEKGESVNEALRKQLSALYQDVDDIKQQTDKNNNQLIDIMENKSDKQIAFSKRSNRNKINDPLIGEVSTLLFPGEDDDSD